jgi:hypothetical protein
MLEQTSITYLRSSSANREFALTNSCCKQAPQINLEPERPEHRRSRCMDAAAACWAHAELRHL